MSQAFASWFVCLIFFFISASFFWNVPLVFVTLPILAWASPLRKTAVKKQIRNNQNRTLFFSCMSAGCIFCLTRGRIKERIKWVRIGRSDPSSWKKILLLISTVQRGQCIPSSTHHNDKILAKTLTESLFHFQNDRSGCTLLTLCPKSARSLHRCMDGLRSN